MESNLLDTHKMKALSLTQLKQMFNYDMKITGKFTCSAYSKQLHSYSRVIRAKVQLSDNNKSSSSTTSTEEAQQPQLISQELQALINSKESELTHPQNSDLQLDEIKGEGEEDQDGNKVKVSSKIQLSNLDYADSVYITINRNKSICKMKQFKQLLLLLSNQLASKPVRINEMHFQLKSIHNAETDPMFSCCSSSDNSDSGCNSSNLWSELIPLNLQKLHVNLIDTSSNEFCLKSIAQRMIYSSLKHLHISIINTNYQSISMEIFSSLKSLSTFYLSVKNVQLIQISSLKNVFDSLEVFELFVDDNHFNNQPHNWRTRRDEDREDFYYYEEYKKKPEFQIVTMNFYELAKLISESKCLKELTLDFSGAKLDKNSEESPLFSVMGSIQKLPKSLAKLKMAEIKLESLNINQFNALRGARNNYRKISLVFHSQFFAEWLKNDLENGNVCEIKLDFSNGTYNNYSWYKNQEINILQVLTRKDYQYSEWINHFCCSVSCNALMLTDIDLRIGQGSFAQIDVNVRNIVMSIATPVLRKLTLDISKILNDYGECYSAANKKDQNYFDILVKNLHSKSRTTLQKLFLNLDGRRLFERKMLSGSSSAADAEDRNSSLMSLLDFPNLTQLVLLGPKARVMQKYHYVLCFENNINQRHVLMEQLAIMKRRFPKFRTEIIMEIVYLLLDSQYIFKSINYDPNRNLTQIQDQPNEYIIHCKDENSHFKRQERRFVFEEQFNPFAMPFNKANELVIEDDFCRHEFINAVWFSKI